jgi:hypothetical protein
MIREQPTGKTPSSMTWPAAGAARKTAAPGRRFGWGRGLEATASPDNSPGSKKLGGTGFPACAKNTLLFKVIKFAVIFKQVISYVKMFMNKAG